MITLIGEDLAQIGLTFVFDGPAKPCENCRFKASCIDSLEKGRKYTITDVKDITQKCEVHDGGIVKAVRVELADVEGLIDSKKVYNLTDISINSYNVNKDHWNHYNHKFNLKLTLVRL